MVYIAKSFTFVCLVLVAMPLVSSFSKHQHHSRFNFAMNAIPCDEYQMSWEPAMARRISKKRGREREKGRPFMVAIVGIPGSGKTTSASLLANVLQTEYGIETMVMPHDGYHYSLDQLKQVFVDSADAIYRRGAPDTFDPVSLDRDLQRIRNNKEESQIFLPGFDHARGDPELDRHEFDRNRHKIVICEGLYLLHDGDGWEQVANNFDFSILVDADVDKCIEQVKIRNQCIPGYTVEEILERCERVDRANAMTVLRGRCRADEIVQSLGFGTSPISS
mmetsp:Transcript_26768/g.39599  ORF Transcript_26768/g.39599 Transcript_26768/m.39599 type:complete len:277 (-) Transcript_26768:61-891(-)